MAFIPLLGSLKKLLVPARDFATSSWALFLLELRWAFFRSNTRPPSAKANNVVVSISSYRERFKYLERTLRCVITQSSPPGKIVVYLTLKDWELVPRFKDLIRLEKFGVNFKAIEGSDWRSYKRLMAFCDFPDCAVAFVDDDLYLRRSLLQDLLLARQRFPGAVVCHGANAITSADGVLSPYCEWPAVKREQKSVANLVVNTGAGTLYPPAPGRLALLEPAAFLSLAPTADDLWLYFAQRRAGLEVFCTGARHKNLIVWFGSQTKALWKTNLTERANDAQFLKLSQFFDPGARAETP